jgi:chemotaxis family two-component system sensor kinase Cph1
MNPLETLFDTSGFMPRWYCGDWTRAHGYLHVVSDSLIWGAYTAIPIVLAYFVIRRRDVPLNKLFWLFAAFIFFCGTTHLVDAMMFYWPAYRFLGAFKVCTAVVSWATVLALIPAVPRALALPGLAKVNAALELEIATRQKAEAELAAANRELRERHRDTTEFISIITHDLKHPIFSIRTLQSLMQQRASDRLDANERNYIDLSLGECDRMIEMLGQLSSLARIDRTQVDIEHHDLRTFLGRCAERFAGGLGERGCRMVVDAPAAGVTFARQQVEQAIANLIDNAIKHGCCDGGDTIRLVGRIGDAAAEITVEDNGAGIDPRHHERVFNLFHKLHGEERPGSGIGLAAVRRLMQRIGGTVELDSQPGTGARFTLRFPVE